MKSISNRYRPPRMLYKLEDGANKRNDAPKTDPASGDRLKIKKNKRVKR